MSKMWRGGGGGFWGYLLGVGVVADVEPFHRYTGIRVTDIDREPVSVHIIHPVGDSSVPEAWHSGTLGFLSG